MIKKELRIIVDKKYFTNGKIKNKYNFYWKCREREREKVFSKLEK